MKKDYDFVNIEALKLSAVICWNEFCDFAKSLSQVENAEYRLYHRRRSSCPDDSSDNILEEKYQEAVNRACAKLFKLNHVFAEEGYNHILTEKVISFDEKESLLKEIKDIM